MVMLQRWSLMEGEWLSYGGGRFSGGGKRWKVYLKENGHVTEVVS